MDESISQKVLDKIKKNKVTPAPKWKFQISHFLVGTLVVVLLGIASLAVSLVLELLFQFHFDRVIFRPNGLRVFLFSFPYLWLIFVAVASILGVAEFLRTKHGYKYKLWEVATVFMSLSIFLGSVIFIAGYSDNTERYFESYVPGYGRVSRTPQQFWSQPEEGLISGVILDNNGEQKILRLEDLMRRDWNVDYSKAQIDKGISLEQGEKIRVVGDRNGNDFSASEIKIWKRGQMRAGPMPMMPPIRPEQ